MLCSFDWCMCLFGWVIGWVMWIALHELDWWQNRDLERFLLHCGVGLSYLFFPFIFEESLKLSLKAKRHVTTFNVWFFKYIQTRSLGALRAPTSSWRPFGPLDFVLRALRALRPVRRARLRSGPPFCFTIFNHFRPLWPCFFLPFFTIWTIWDHLEQFGTILDHFGSFWTILDHFGPFWTILDHFGPF